MLAVLKKNIIFQGGDRQAQLVGVLLLVKACVRLHQVVVLTGIFTQAFAGTDNRQTSYHYGVLFGKGSIRGQSLSQHKSIHIYMYVFLASHRFELPRKFALLNAGCSEIGIAIGVSTVVRSICTHKMLASSQLC